ncbi:hypothetical protein D3C76_563770 [compost metagenome]
MPPVRVSGGKPTAGGFGVSLNRKSNTANKHSAITRNTEAVLHQAIRAPASAGPKARVALMAIPFNDTAAGT